MEILRLKTNDKNRIKHLNDETLMSVLGQYTDKSLKYKKDLVTKDIKSIWGRLEPEKKTIEYFVDLYMDLYNEHVIDDYPSLDFLYDMEQPELTSEALLTQLSVNRVDLKNLLKVKSDIKNKYSGCAENMPENVKFGVSRIRKKKRLRIPGIFASEIIQNETVLGTFEGSIIETNVPLKTSRFIWKIEFTKNMATYLDGTNQEKNWLKFITRKNFPERQNVLAILRNETITFITCKEIGVDEELRVYYSKEYGKSVGFNGWITRKCLKESDFTFGSKGQVENIDLRMSVEDMFEDEPYTLPIEPYQIMTSFYDQKQTKHEESRIVNYETNYDSYGNLCQYECHANVYSQGTSSTLNYSNYNFTNNGWNNYEAGNDGEINYLENIKKQTIWEIVGDNNERYLRNDLDTEDKLSYKPGPWLQFLTEDEPVENLTNFYQAQFNFESKLLNNFEILLKSDEIRITDSDSNANVPKSEQHFQNDNFKMDVPTDQNNVIFIEKMEGESNRKSINSINNQNNEFFFNIDEFKIKEKTNDFDDKKLWKDKDINFKIIKKDNLSHSGIGDKGKENYLIINEDCYGKRREQTDREHIQDNNFILDLSKNKKIKFFKNEESNGSLSKSSLNHVKNNNSDIGIECKICKEPFTKDAIISHYKEEHKIIKVICTICKNLFHKSALNLHIKEIHQEVKVECHICKKLFSQNGSLNIHIKEIHQSIKFKCTICKKLFSQSSNLKAHIREVHEKVKVECTICKKLFNGHLKRHIKEIHEKIKFECTICKKLFSRGNLNIHIQKCHQKIKAEASQT